MGYAGIWDTFGINMRLAVQPGRSSNSSSSFLTSLLGALAFAQPQESSTAECCCCLHALPLYRPVPHDHYCLRLLLLLLSPTAVLLAASALRTRRR
jgi:hypothetical protein